MKKEFNWQTAASILAAVGLLAILVILCGALFFMTPLRISFCPFWSFYRIGLVMGMGSTTICLIILFLLFSAAGVKIFKRRLNRIWKYLLVFTASAALIFLCVNGVISCGYAYYSHFTVQKWHDDPPCRYLMIDDMEKKYQITGMSKQEITDLFGDPTEIVTRGQYEIYEYFISHGYIDPVTYDVYFDNDIVVKTAQTEH